MGSSFGVRIDNVDPLNVVVGVSGWRKSHALREVRLDLH
jgi:hypothetical protein